MSTLCAEHASRVIPKLNAEADAQLGPGGPANAKRGTLDVHRGGSFEFRWTALLNVNAEPFLSTDTYQFGYFLRGTEPHAVLIKAGCFSLKTSTARLRRCSTE